MALTIGQDQVGSEIVASDLADEDGFNYDSHLRVAGRPGIVVQYSIVPMSYQLWEMSEQVSAIMRDMSHVAYQTVVASPDDVTFAHTHHYYQHVGVTLRALETLRILSQNLVQYTETMPTFFEPQDGGV